MDGRQKGPLASVRVSFTVVAGVGRAQTTLTVGLGFRSLGFPVATDPKWDVPTVVGRRPPVEATLAVGAGRGNATWLMQQFGLA